MCKIVCSFYSCYFCKKWIFFSPSNLRFFFTVKIFTVESNPPQFPSTLPYGQTDQLTVFLSPDPTWTFFFVKRFLLQNQRYGHQDARIAILGLIDRARAPNCVSKDPATIFGMEWHKLSRMTGTKASQSCDSVYRRLKRHGWCKKSFFLTFHSKKSQKS